MQADIPWQQFLALVRRIPQQRAKRLLDAMTAARAASLDGRDFQAIRSETERTAYPDRLHPAVFALRQSVKDADG